MTLSAKNLTEQSIRDLAGDAVFQRGYVYYNEGRASVKSQSKTTLVIQVQGSEEYAVKLNHTSRQFEASCHCPAAQGFDFCKHCVAASLLYLEILAQKETLKSSSGNDLLKAYLTSLPKEQLVSALSEHISRNPITLQNWMLRAETAAEKLDARAFKKHITAAIPYNRDLHRYPQVQAYFNKIVSLLERLKAEEEQLEPDQLLKLSDYAIIRIRRALETVDDSGGFRYDALEILAELHSSALQHSVQTSRQKADYLLRIYLGEESDFYPEIPDHYAATVGDEVLDLFHQRLHQRWESLPELDPRGSDSRHFDRKLDYLHTLAPLLKKARAEKDTATEIHYLEKSATNVRDMVALSALYAESDNITTARSWLNKAENLSDQSRFREDRGAIIDQQIELLVLEDHPEEAMAVRWQRFEESRTFDAYLKVCELADRLNDQSDIYKKALSILQAPSNATDANSLTDELVKIHLHEEQYVAALQLANNHPVNIYLLTELVTTVSGEPELTLPLLERAIEFHINMKNQKGYEEAVKVLTSVHGITKKKDRKPLVSFIERLKDTNKSKRNLISLIEQNSALKNP